MNIGAHYLGEGQCRFTVWSPFAESLAIRLVTPREQLVPMSRDEKGYWQTTIEDVFPGATYFCRLKGGTDRPDPASQFQPEGVHRVSQVVNHRDFQWTDGSWPGLGLEELIIYELHTGTFTPEGTFTAIIARLDGLKDLGINAIELMPISQFPGERNWGYDGVHPFAVQNSYGTPDDLKRLIDACHQRGIAVLLDVVYNHLGPEGNYLSEFAPYFTDKYRTPWGSALNFDGEYSDEVRNFFLQSALLWLREYHFDGFRLDAIQDIFDQGAYPFLQELADTVHDFSEQHHRQIHLIAETNLNDPRVIRPKELGGIGIDAQWNDDFHHSLRVLLTGERAGYYADYGQTAHLATALSEGFVYSGQYSVHAKSRVGASAADRPSHQFVVFTQNHDQVGNRMMGERLSQLVSFEALKLAAGAMLLAPNVPMLFMGEEYGESSPFLYFVSHGDADLIAAVREGRKKEFAAFAWQGEPPDPQSMETFQQSKLRWELRNDGRHNTLLEFYRELIRLRRAVPSLVQHHKKQSQVFLHESDRLIFHHRTYLNNETLCVMNFNQHAVGYLDEWSAGSWKKVIDSAEPIWNGPGATLPEKIKQGDQLTIQPLSVVLYQKENS